MYPAIGRTAARPRRLPHNSVTGGRDNYQHSRYVSVLWRAEQDCRCAVAGVAIETLHPNSRGQLPFLCRWTRQSDALAGAQLTRL
jgi:hypothetical protein